MVDTRIYHELRMYSFLFRNRRRYHMPFFRKRTEQQKLLDELSHRYSNTRAVAAQMLGLGRDTSVVPALIDTLSDINEGVRKSAALALARLGDRSGFLVLTKLLSGTGSLHWSVHDETMLAVLGDLSDTNTKQSWLLTKEQNRCQAVAVLVNFADRSVISALTGALSDPNSNVRRFVAEVLRELGDTSAVPALIDALSDPNSDVRRLVVEVLRKLSDTSAVPALIDLLSDSDVIVRLDTYSALAELGDTSAIPAPIGVLSDPHNRDRTDAARVLGELGDMSAVPALIDALSDSESDVRLDTARALGVLGNPAAIFALIEAVADQNSDVRDRVTESLAELDDGTVVPALIGLLSDEPFISGMAASALGNLGDTSAVPALLKANALSDSGPNSDGFWFRRALENLSSIGLPQLSANFPVAKLELNRFTPFEFEILNAGVGPAWLSSLWIHNRNLGIKASQEINETLLSEDSWKGHIEITPQNIVGESIPLQWSIEFYNVEGQTTVDGIVRIIVEDTNTASITTTHGDIIQHGGIKQEEGVILQKNSTTDSDEPTQETKSFGFCPNCGEELNALKTPKFCPHCREQLTA
jgi:HEAT repeat protein